MVGSYCMYCKRRCFVERWAPNTRANHFATCAAGAAHDRSHGGYDYTTAFNPALHDQETVIEAYQEWKKEELERCARI